MFSYISQAKIKTEKEKTVWLGHMLLYFSPWEPFLPGITYCMEQESFSPGQGHRIAQAAQVPRRRRGSIFNLQFQHQRWPVLETGGKMDHWVCSGVIAPVFCSTERVVINKSAASGGHLPADEQWDCCAGLCSPACFLLLLKCDVGWQLCGISHMERNWTNCGGFSHMGPIHAWWTPVEAAGAAPAERLTRHIQWFIVVLLSWFKHSKFSP